MFHLHTARNDWITKSMHMASMKLLREPIEKNDIGWEPPADVTLVPLQCLHWVYAAASKWWNMVGVWNLCNFCQDSSNGQILHRDSPLALLWLSQSCTAVWGSSYPVSLPSPSLLSQNSGLYLLWRLSLPTPVLSPFYPLKAFPSRNCLHLLFHPGICFLQDPADILYFSPEVWFVEL